MRVTTQMLFEASMKTGIPLCQHSLLDYINNDSNSTSLLDALQSTSNNTVSSLEKTKYEKQGKAADELNGQMEKFMDEGEDNIFEKAKASGSTEEICKEVETFTDKYNYLLSILGGSSNMLNVLYKQSMKELVSESKESLEEIGITADKNGNLKVDQDKLKGVSLESLEKVFGKDSDFLTKLSFLASKVEDNADANLESISNQYNINGMNYSAFNNSKYDFLG